MTGPGIRQNWGIYRIDIDLQDQLVVIAFTIEDADKAGKLAQKVLDRLPELIESTTSTVALDVLKNLKRRWPDELRRQQEQMGGFRGRLHLRRVESVARVVKQSTLSLAKIA
jgi:hypothetical protein